MYLVQFYWRNCMRSLLSIIISIFVSQSAFAQAKVDAVSFKPGKAPKLEGALAPNELLTNATILGKGLLDGPEDIAIDEGGNIYTGLADGTIRKVNSEEVTTIAKIGDHPFGHSDSYATMAPEGRSSSAISLRSPSSAASFSSICSLI